MGGDGKVIWDLTNHVRKPREMAFLSIWFMFIALSWVGKVIIFCKLIRMFPNVSRQVETKTFVQPVEMSSDLAVVVLVVARTSRNFYFINMGIVRGT